MRRLILKVLDRVLGPQAAGDICGTCGWPAVQGIETVLVSNDEELGKCAECGGPIDGDGKPMGELDADGTRSLKLIIVSHETKAAVDGMHTRWLEERKAKEAT